MSPINQHQTNFSNYLEYKVQVTNITLLKLSGEILAKSELLINFWQPLPFFFFCFYHQKLGHEACSSYAKSSAYIHKQEIETIPYCSKSWSSVSINL